MEEYRVEMLKLKCENCGVGYEKPSIFKKYLVETNNNVFYKWSLLFCDKCRREKQNEALKSLPEILNAITKNI